MDNHTSVMLAAKGICNECGYAHGTHRTDCPRIGGTTGYVAHVAVDKGYGFIKVRGQADEVYFHANDLTAGLAFGPQLMERFVRFDVAQDRSGRWGATNVRPGD